MNAKKTIIPMIGIIYLASLIITSVILYYVFRSVNLTSTSFLLVFYSALFLLTLGVFFLHIRKYMIPNQVSKGDANSQFRKFMGLDNTNSRNSTPMNRTPTPYQNQQNTFYMIISLIIMLGLTGGLILAVIPSGSTINNYDRDYDNRDWRYTYNYDSETGESVTDTIFVSPIGDNSTGGNWESAFTDIWTALNEASTNAYNMTLILLGKGEYDVNQTGTPTVSANVIIRGCCIDDITVIYNNHTNAEWILKFTKVTYLQSLKIDLDDTEVSIGAIWHTNSHFYMEGCTIMGVARTDTLDLVRIQGSGTTVGSESVHLMDNTFHGDYRKNYTTALNLINHTTGGVIHNTHFILGNVGIESDNSDSFGFEHTTFRALSTAIFLDDESNNWDFDETHFIDNIYEINTSSYILFHEHSTYLNFEEIKMVPEDDTDGDIITGAGAGVYGAWVNWSYSPTLWYKLIGVTFSSPSDGSAYYRIQVRIWCPNDNVHNTLGEYLFEPSATDFTTTLELLSGVLCRNSIVSYRLMTSDGGSDTIEAFAQIVEF